MNEQMYFAIAVPVFAIIMGMIISTLQMNSIGGRFTGIESGFTSLDNRLR